MNCLIGSGDSGKTTVLDAIDFCLGARRNIAFSDYDFHATDTTKPISVTVALGSLEDGLLNVDRYGDFIHGFNPNSQEFDPEPAHGLEPVLILRLTVEKDLEPQWRLLSKRANEKGLERNLRWEDRQSVSPVRLGEHTDWHLAWRRGALFERLTDEKLGLSDGLSDAARQARSNFGQLANAELIETLDTVKRSAASLGVRTGDQVQALLDAGSVKFGTGAISLHDAANVPLSSLGTGSKRLLVAGLAREVTKSASISLVDEIETGLEPHRIRSLLNALGAKTAESQQQVFATTHSPVVLRELSHSQLSIMRRNHEGKHTPLAPSDAAQGVLRGHSEVFLGNRVIVCEGKSELGFLRGRDQFLSANGAQSYEALGTVPTDAGGASNVLRPAEEFLRLGYPTAIFMDSDKPLTEEEQNRFKGQGGALFCWPNDWALEDAIFQNATYAVIVELLDFARTLDVGPKVDDQLKSITELGFDDVRNLAFTGQMTAETAGLVGTTARKCGWFKQIAPYEHVARNILSPHWATLNANLTNTADALWRWASDAH